VTHPHHNQYNRDTVPPGDPRQYAVRTPKGSTYRLRLQSSREVAFRRRDELGDGAVVVVYDQTRGEWGVVNDESSGEMAST
jgi:hypothetical protein